MAEVKKLEGCIKIQLLYKVNIEVAVSEGEDGEGEFETHPFEPGVTHEVDVLDDYGDNADIQFGDGSVVFGLQKEHFEVVE